MAKGKHSAALFEVINNSKRPERAAQSLRTPKWWFKGRQTPGEMQIPETSGSQSDVITTASAPVAESEPRPSAPSGAARQSSLRFPKRSSAVHLDFSRDRQEITLRLRYTTAIVTAFGICAVVGMAYVVGRHLSHGPQTASAVEPSTPIARPLSQQPAQQGVTDVNHQRTHAPIDPATARHENTNPPAPRSPAPMTTALVPASAETGMPRAIGLNYVIIQTYPPDETKTAEAARDFLTQHGMPCTLEKTDYVHNANWVCLVGTAGFTRISSADYKTYTDNILKLGDKFPTTHFDKFKPAAYKWKG